MMNANVNTITEVMNIVWEMKDCNPNTIELNCENLSRKIFTNNQIKIGNGFDKFIESMKQLSIIDSQENFYDTIEDMTFKYIRICDRRDFDSFREFFDFVDFMRYESDYSEMKSFIEALIVFLQKLTETYNNEFKKDEVVNKMENKTNGQRYVLSDKVDEIVQEVATSTELGSLVVQFEALTRLDESIQKAYFEAYCEAASSIADSVPVPSENMGKSYLFVRSCINDLLGTGEDLFATTLEKTKVAIINNDYIDDDDAKFVTFMHSYITTVYDNGNNTAHAKELLKVLNLYFKTVYDFVKKYAEQH